MAYYEYNVNGVPFYSEDPLTEEEQKEAAMQFSAENRPANITLGGTAAPKQDGKQSIADAVQNGEGLDVANLLKKGLSRGIGFAGEAASYNPLTAIPAALTRLAAGNPVIPSEGEYSRPLLESMGGRDTPPSPDFGRRVLEESIMAVADPTSYIGAGAGLLNKMLRAGGAAVTGGMAEIGATTGEGLEEAMTGQKSGAGRMIGGLASGLTASQAAPAISAGVTQPVSAGMKYLKRIKENPDEYVDSKAAGYALRFLEDVASHDKMTPDQMLKSLDDFQQISNKISGADTPLIIAMSNNPAMKEEAVKLIKSGRTGAEFRGKLEAELQRVATAVEAQSNKIAGTQRFANVNGLTPSAAKVAAANRQIDLIDEKIAKATSSVQDPNLENITQASLGGRVQDMISEKMKLAEKAISPQYDDLATEAMGANVRMPAAGTKMINDYIVQSGMKSMFEPGTEMDRIIKGILAPKGGDKSAMEMRWGKAGAPESEYPELSFDNVMSLNRALNKLKRNKYGYDKDEFRKIQQLESVVNDARKTIPGDWSKRLDDIDGQFWEKVGVPYRNSEAINLLDQKKFNELVAPVLTTKPTVMRDFLTASKGDGVPIARDAILAEIYDRAVRKNGGVFNQKEFDKYLNNRAKSEVINEVPGLREELNGIKENSFKLGQWREQLAQKAAAAEKELSDNYFTKLNGAPPNYTQISNSLMGDRAFYMKFRNDLNQLPANARTGVINNLRREVINTALENKDGALAYLTDPKNAFAINGIFGKGYQRDLQNLAKYADKAKTADITSMLASPTQESLDPVARVLPGVKSPFLFSKARQRVSSYTQRAFEIFTKIAETKMADARNKQLMQVMFEPSNIEHLKTLAQKGGLKANDIVSAKKTMEAFMNVFPSYMIIGAQTGREEVPAQEYIPSMTGIGGY